MIYSSTRNRSKFFRFGPLTAGACSIILCILLCANRVGATTHTDTLQCSSTSTFNLDSTLVGITLNDTIRIIGSSDTDTSVSIKMTNDSGAYSLTDSKPFIIKKDSAHLLFLHFAPSARHGYFGSLELSFGLCKYTVQLIGSGIGPTSNNSVFSLSNAGHEVIAFQFQNTDSESLRLSFRNDLGDTVHIQSINFLTNDTLLIDSVLSDSTVPPNAQFTIQVTSFLRSPRSIQSHLLMAVRMPNHTIQEEVISVQSLRLQNDAVTQPPAEPIYFEIYPNPAHGKATLHSEGLSHPHVTITNILGQVVRDEAVANDWLWDGMSSAGNSEPAGTYYVIASGITSNWQHVQKVLPLILMR